MSGASTRGGTGGTGGEGGKSGRSGNGNGNGDGKARRTPAAAVRWWWETRVRSWWSVRLPAARRRRASAGAPTLGFTRRGTELGDSIDGGITAILTVYRRGEYLAAQIDALRAQSVPPDEIWVWCNDGDVPLEDVSPLVDRVIVSNSNWKFWGRFAIANLARTEHVGLYDDDVLPGPRWHENCLATIAAGHDGILGGSGVVLPLAGGYSSRHKVGWNGHHLDAPREVDLVGHAWFFRKAHLRFMWAGQPSSWQNGEDIHFSCMAAMHGDVRTWVPPHPEGERELWSCRPDFGKRVGRTSAATFKAAGHHAVLDEMVDACRAAGWRIVAEREPPGAGS